MTSFARGMRRAVLKRAGTEARYCAVLCGTEVRWYQIGEALNNVELLLHDLRLWPRW